MRTSMRDLIPRGSKPPGVYRTLVDPAPQWYAQNSEKIEFPQGAGAGLPRRRNARPGVRREEDQDGGGRTFRFAWTF